MAKDQMGGGSASPIFETDNMLHGALRRPDADASMGERRAKATAWWSLALALLWGFGLASLIAVPLGAGAIIGLRNAAVRGPALWAAVAGLLLGLVGLAVSVVSYLSL